MPRGNNAMDLCLRRLVQVSRQWLILNRRDRILGYVVPGDREELQHRGQRDIDPLVGPVIVPASNLCRHANDLEPITIQRNERAQRWVPKKQKPFHLLSQYHHLGPMGYVVLVEKSSLRQWQMAYLRVVQPDPHPLPAGTRKLAHLLQVAALDQRRGISHIGSSSANRICIAHRQLVRMHSHMLLRQHRYGATPHHDHVRAKLREALALPGAKPLAQPNQQQQRSHTPRNAEHRQKRTNLVSSDRSKHLGQNIEKCAHGQSLDETSPQFVTQNQIKRFPFVNNHLRIDASSFHSSQKPLNTYTTVFLINAGTSGSSSRRTSIPSARRNQPIAASVDSAAATG